MDEGTTDSHIDQKGSGSAPRGECLHEEGLRRNGMNNGTGRMERRLPEGLRQDRRFTREMSTGVWNKRQQSYMYCTASMKHTQADEPSGQMGPQYTEPRAAGGTRTRLKGMGTITRLRTVKRKHMRKREERQHGQEH